MSYLSEVEPGDEAQEPESTEPEGPINWELVGRGLKSSKMAATAEALFINAGLDPYVDAEQIARTLRAFTDAQWLDLQTAAGIQIKLPAHRRKPPSVITRGLVIDVFSKRVDVAQEDQ